MKILSLLLATVFLALRAYPMDEVRTTLPDDLQADVKKFTMDAQESLINQRTPGNPGQPAGSTLSLLVQLNRGGTNGSSFEEMILALRPSLNDDLRRRSDELLTRYDALAPARTIGARLEVIKAAHPAEYEKGLSRWLALPQPSIPPLSSPSMGSSEITIPGASTSPPP